MLFAVAHENEMDVELETLCLETIFSQPARAPSATGRLFVNASAMLLRHPVFLDERNLAAINRSHADVVVEISEKEMVRDYDSFQEVLELVRRANMKIAIDDAGSGYSGLETILHLKPDYIKVADSLVRNIHNDPIKREIIRASPRSAKRIGAAARRRGHRGRGASARALVDLGIEFGQGFLLGRPGLPGQRPGLPRRRPETCESRSAAAAGAGFSSSTGRASRRAPGFARPCGCGRAAAAACPSGCRRPASRRASAVCEKSSPPTTARPERPPRLGAGAEPERDRQRADQRGHGRHHDRAEAHEAGLVDRLLGGACRSSLAPRSRSRPS